MQFFQLRVFISVFVTETQTAYAAGGQNDAEVFLLLGVVVLLLGAKIGGSLAVICKQPAVLGELIAGIVLGNLPHVGISAFAGIGTDSFFTLLSSMGVLLLLFEVGLGSSILEMRQVGGSAIAVAAMGVAAPFLLGIGVSKWLLPDRSLYLHLFIGATLSATSVGITARVLKDLGKLHLREAKIILGAAVVDDVLGLLLLAIVAGMITGVGEAGASFSGGDLGLLIGKALGFLILVIALGPRLSTALFTFGGKLSQAGMWLPLALCYCFSCAYIAHWFGLAPLVGAFAAGLTIDAVRTTQLLPHEKGPIEDQLGCLAQFFVPIFFVHAGMGVDLSVLAEAKVIVFGTALTVAAIIGKQVCGWAIWGAAAKDLNRTLIGIGMIPRGEVGLIFAISGKSLLLGGAPVLDPTLYSAIVLMVIATTLVTPPGLMWALQRTSRGRVQ